MRANHLQDVIATDIPQPVERAALEIDEDITRSDAWMFAPLIATVVALPLVVTILFAFSVWHLAGRHELSLTSTAPTTFASRWPDKSMPLIVIR